ncbi:protein VPRBP [Elysia marginata]|uniref:Protein VPRBP n=1 Tax=Elysia marginata TaxID=1093978 RepID=A0AAV4IEC5_9GAST|nr:protein VPRBP [Elysia marginata]
MAQQGRNAPVNDNVASFQATLEDWTTKYNGSASFDPVPILNKLAEFLEHETEEFYKMDPDPLDDRPPGRQIASCGQGQMMKIIFKNDDFMNTIVGSYLLDGSYRDGGPLFTASCRVLLDLLPGLETSVPFRETEGVVERLYHWAEHAAEPLKSYATGLLSGAMELNDVAVKFREESMHLVPVMLQRLHTLVSQHTEEAEKPNISEGGQGDRAGKSPRHFAAVAAESSKSPGASTKSSPLVSDHGDSRTGLKRPLSPNHSFNQPFKRSRNSSEGASFFENEHSNSSWAELQPLVIGSYSLQPLTNSMKQRLILQYLTPLGDYHELLSPILEHNAMDLIFHYIDLSVNKDVRLAFESLRFLSVILCHKKFAAEFITRGGIQRLLKIHRPSIAATGVSLCFYYITYFEDATERLCNLPEHILSEVVSYNLWLMECSHDSSRCHACLFFSQSFPYKIILELFDAKDGLRRLINAISTLSILNQDGDQNHTDDELHQMRQAARLVTEAVRKYFEVHTTLKADELRCLHLHDGRSSLKESRSVKGCKFSLEENMDVLLEFLPPKSNWTPEIALHKLGGVLIMCSLVAISPDWDAYHGKGDTVVAALDVLAMCSVSHRTQLMLANTLELNDNVRSPVMSMIVGFVEGDLMPDAEISKSALRLICNCVCGPAERFGSAVVRYHKKRNNGSSNSEEDMLTLMWNTVRSHNGIMVLLKSLSVKTPIILADSIRMLASKALVGMSRSDTIRQIIEKLPPLNNGHLQTLMKEPVLADCRNTHLQFCKYASTLLEKLAGRQANVVGSATLEEIRKAGVVAQTKIVFHEKELLQLIQGHLTSLGLLESAATLQREAGLPKCSTPPPHNPGGSVASGHLYSPGTPKLGRQLSHTGTSQTNREIFPSTPTPWVHPTQPLTVSTAAGNSSHQAMPSASSMSSEPSSSQSVRSLAGPSTPAPLSASASTPGPSCAATPATPTHMKFTLHRTPHASQQLTPQQRAHKRKYLKERESYVPLGQRAKSKQNVEYNVSLNNIVTEYLRKQHALCPQPISTCPTMSLFIPHRCPEPLGKACAAYNITSRVFDRQLRPPYGGPKGQSLNRRYIHSKLCALTSFRDGAGDGLACCAFDCAADNIFIGSFSGDLRVMNINTTTPDFYSTVCHSSPVIHISTSKVNPDILFTSTWGASQNCALWNFNRTDVNVKLSYRFDEYTANLANQSHDRFIGTKEMIARIYDTATGTVVQTMYDQVKANGYKYNEATFNPTDDLVLNDGNLWDVRSNKLIYKFDKFNQYTSGCFHPRGLEVVINSEIWDIRTFRLLNTIPALDQCQIMFNHSGDVIYAIRVDDESQGDLYTRRDYASTLRTYDALNYCNIGTFDLKTSSIFDVAINRDDTLLGIIENTNQPDADSEEAFCRIYEVGKNREPEDQVEDDDDNPQNDEPDDYDDDDDDDDGDDDDDDDDAVLQFVDGSSDSDSDNNNNNDNDNDEMEVAELSPSGSSDDDDNDDDDEDDDDPGDLDDVLFELA